MKYSLWLAGLGLFCAPGVYADNAQTEDVNMMWIVAASALVFFMQAGFAFLESGMSRAKNSVNVLMKNYLDMCLGTLIFWCVGYGLMFGNNPSGWFGSSNFFYSSDSLGDYGFILFQLMFASTAVTIASGAMAERTKFAGYLWGALLIAAIIYPIFGAWAWNPQGWLNQMGFKDFAGSSVVHSIGAWCALAGIMVLGPRLGRFDKEGKPRDIRGHNLNLVVLGGFILWFGWFGFNAGSSLQANLSLGRIALNTQLAAAAGAVGALLWFALRGKPILLTDTVNGSLAGLVAITAGCNAMEPHYAILTGLVGGFLCCLASRWMLAMGLDDVVGAVPVHGIGGVWGTLAAGLFFIDNPFNLDIILVQICGILVCFIWGFGSALLMYTLIARILGLRASSQEEQRGLDLAEHAEVGYPEFQADIAYNLERASQIEARP
jgi:ammonium transporter, Amt family